MACHPPRSMAAVKAAVKAAVAGRPHGGNN